MTFWRHDVSLDHLLQLFGMNWERRHPSPRYRVSEDEVMVALISRCRMDWRGGAHRCSKHSPGLHSLPRLSEARPQRHHSARHHSARRRGRWLPAGDGPCAGPYLRMVGDPRETLPQLDDGRQFAVLVEGGANRSGIGFCHDEHGQSMGHVPLGRQARSWTRPVPSRCPAQAAPDRSGRQRGA